MANLRRLLTHGRTGGTGKLVVLPVDQGFEHEENRQTALGGGFGTIMGRNSFQRPHDEAVQLLHDVMDIHVGTTESRGD